VASEFIGGAPPELSGTSYDNGGGARQGYVYRPAVPYIISGEGWALNLLRLTFLALCLLRSTLDHGTAVPPKVLKVPEGSVGVGDL